MIVAVDANQSTNWSGYNQGTLEQGNKLFNQVSGDWTVPAATQHTTGQDEFSSTWVGIGGGCVDAGCNVVDTTLIQAGTEQDVDSAGRASYSAWFELVVNPRGRGGEGDLLLPDVFERPRPDRGDEAFPVI